MKKIKKISSFFSVCLILSVILGNFSLPVLAYEKKDVNFEQVRTKILSDNSGATFNKINSLPKEVKSFSLNSSITIKEKKKDYVEGEILVKYKKNKINLQTVSGRATALNFIRAKSLEKKEDLRKINISVLRIKDAKTVEQKIAELRNDQNVEYAQPNFQYYPLSIDTNDTYKEKLWGLDNIGQSVNGVSGTPNADIDAPEAWAINEGTNASIIIAVIDSGVAYNHPDLAANMWDGTSCKDEDGNAIAGGCNHGYDYEDGDNIPLPTTSSHGTHIAGTIAAVKGNGLGIIGVAPQAKIMALKSSLTTSDNIKSINFAKQNGAKVINASWACYGSDQGGTHAVCGGSVDYDYRDLAMINAIESFLGLFITAAGNGDGDTDSDGDNHDSGQTLHSYPCDHTANNIICVAATDQNDNLAPFSDYGAISVDVGAPGVNIYSTVPGLTPSLVLNETFEGIDNFDIPSGWIKTDYWGVFDTGVEYWDEVLYGDVSHIPYKPLIDSTITLPTQNLGNATGATIDFWTACDTEYWADWYDYMALEISKDGVNYDEFLRWDEVYLDLLNDESPLDPSGSAVHYFQQLIPADYLTNNFKLRFRWFTDSSNVSDINYNGCLINDLTINKYTYTDGSDEQYDFSDGTSMAAPHVAGLAALVWGTKPSLTYTEVKNSILNTGDPLPSLDGKTVTGKRINAFNALDSVTPPVISNVQTATTTATSTAVIWSTDLPATSKVAYSTTTPVSSIIVSTSTLVTNHSMELTGLSASTTYYFYTESADKYGNVATSSEQSFATLSVPAVPDTIPPVITLNGSSTVDILVGDTYVDAGAIAIDNIDGDITANIVVVNPVSTSTVGTYTITYNVSDAAGNPAEQVIRTVNVNPIPLSSAKAITNFILSGQVGETIINETTHTISVTVPSGVNVAALVSTIVITGVSVNPASGVAQNFTSPVIYTVTAADSSTQEYIVWVAVASNTDIVTDKAALVDDSIKGGNPDLSNITVALTNPLPALGANGSTIAWASGNTDVVSNDGQTINRPAFASGNATVILTATLTKGVVTDTKVFTLTVIKLPASTVATITSATYTVSPGGTASETITNIPFGTSKATFLAALAKSEVNQTWNDTGIADPVVSGNTLVVTAQDETTIVTYTVTTALNPAKAITTFSFDGLGAGAIDEVNHTITVTVPFGTNVTALVSTIVITGVSVNPASGVAQNFTSPVIYTVTAEDNTTQAYTVTVTVSANTVANILSFNSTAPVAVGAISGTNITLTVPFGTSLTNLPITISLSTGASVLPVDGNTTFVDGVATIYTVTAQDTVTTKNYSVTVNVAANSAKDITSFNFTDLTPNIAGVISGADITLNVLYGTDVTALVSTIAITGALVSPASGVAQDFTSPVTYTVTAADATTQTYTVTVIVAAPSDLTALTTAIATAQGKHDIAVEGNLPGQYPAPLMVNLQTAINTASAITIASAQSVVDAAVTTLNTAIATFEAGIVLPDTIAPVIILTGGNMSIYQGTTYTDAGATASDDVDGNITANIVTVNLVNSAIVGNYTITYNISDAAGNHAVQVIRIVNVLSVSSSSQLLSENTTVSTSTPEILVGGNNTASSIITIPDSVTNATINVSALTTSTATSTTATIQGAMTINVSTTIGAVKVEIPAGVQIVAGTSTWNGVINAPQIKENSTVTATPDSGNTATVSSVIEMGFGNTMLNFNKAVRIKITGQAGKYVGYSRNGVFTPITNVCSADSQVAGDALSPEGDCKISVGSDLIIWTKHFTNFVTYTQTAILPVVVATSGGGGGGGGYTPPVTPATTKAGDANGDNKIDKYDFALMMSNWGKTGTNVCDFNSDGKVDKYDFALLMSKWGL